MKKSGGASDPVLEHLPICQWWQYDNDFIDSRYNARGHLHRRQLSLIQCNFCFWPNGDVSARCNRVRM